MLSSHYHDQLWLPHINYVITYVITCYFTINMQPLISEPSHVVFELFSHRKCLDSTYFAWNSMHQRYWLVVYQTHFHFFTVTFSDLPCNRWGHVDESDEHQPLSGPTQQNISWSSTCLWQTEEGKKKKKKAGEPEVLCGSSAIRRRNLDLESFHQRPPVKHPC